jgi:hypothetical protein
MHDFDVERDNDLYKPFGVIIISRSNVVLDLRDEGHHLCAQVGNNRVVLLLIIDKFNYHADTLARRCGNLLFAAIQIMTEKVVHETVVWQAVEDSSIVAYAHPTGKTVKHWRTACFQ